jgi:hypothetical protein
MWPIFVLGVYGCNLPLYSSYVGGWLSGGRVLMVDREGIVVQDVLDGGL